MRPETGRQKLEERAEMQAMLPWTSDEQDLWLDYSVADGAVVIVYGKFELRAATVITHEC